MRFNQASISPRGSSLTRFSSMVVRSAGWPAAGPGACAGCPTAWPGGPLVTSAPWGAGSGGTTWSPPDEAVFAAFGVTSGSASAAAGAGASSSSSESESSETMKPPVVRGGVGLACEAGGSGAGALMASGSYSAPSSPRSSPKSPKSAEGLAPCEGSCVCSSLSWISGW